MQNSDSSSYWSLLEYLFDRECPLWEVSCVPRSNSLGLRHFAVSDGF